MTVKRLSPFVLQIPVSALKCSDLLCPGTKNKAGHCAALQVFLHTVAEPVFLILGGCEMRPPFVWVVFPLRFVRALDSVFTN